MSSPATLFELCANSLAQTRTLFCEIDDLPLPQKIKDKTKGSIACLMDKDYYKSLHAEVKHLQRAIEITLRDTDHNQYAVLHEALTELAATEMANVLTLCVRKKV